MWFSILPGCVSFTFEVGGLTRNHVHVIFHVRKQAFHTAYIALGCLSSLARIWGECSNMPRLRFFFFFGGGRLTRAHWFHSLGQDPSTVAQRAEMTVAECSLASCVWARFWIGSHTMPGQQHSQLTPTSSQKYGLEKSHSNKLLSTVDWPCLEILCDPFPNLSSFLL